MITIKNNAFGMVMPERSFSYEKYRWGYQGSEMENGVDEMATGCFTTFYREGDSRLCRWLSVDPKSGINPWESPFALMAGNPITETDKQGDDLDVGSNPESQADVKSLVRTENQSLLSFNPSVHSENLVVSLSLIPYSPQFIENKLKNDEGLKMVVDLVSSEKKYLYEASDAIMIQDQNYNNTFGMTYRIPHNIINASNYGDDSNGGHDHRPQNGYDGQVIIHPQAQFEEFDNQNNIVTKPRASLVFHELAENYERTNNGVAYSGNNGAHELAKKRELLWWGKSFMPGEVSKIIPGPKPTAARQAELLLLNKSFMGFE
jgi:hypothetical protein